MKTLCLIIALLLIGTPAIASAYGDIENHWAKEYVESLTARGVLDVEDEYFHPDDYISAKEYILLLLKNINAPLSLDYALKNELIEDGDVQSATLERRWAARICREFLIREYNERDEDDISAAEVLDDLYSCHSCVMNIAQVYQKGIMTGRGEGTFDVYAYLTRAEAAAIAVRMNDSSMRRSVQSGVKNTQITKEAAAELIKSDSRTALVDVRTAQEHAERHIEGSINIELDDILNDIDLSRLPEKDAPIILYCRSGARSARALRALEEKGYTNLYDLGGIDD